MDSRWIGFFVFIWMIGSLMGMTYDGMTNPADWASAGYSTGNMTNQWSDMLGSNVATQKIPIVGSITFLTPAVNFIQSLTNALLWNFSFVQEYPIVARILNIFGIIGLVGLYRLVYGSITGNITWG